MWDFLTVGTGGAGRRRFAASDRRHGAAVGRRQVEPVGGPDVATLVEFIDPLWSGLRRQLQHFVRRERTAGERGFLRQALAGLGLEVGGTAAANQGEGQ